MGLFDRLIGKKTSAAPAPRAIRPAPATPAPTESVSEPAAAAPETSPTASSPAGSVVPQLTAARECLEIRDLPGAIAIYEEVLEAAGDRPDVLVTISADLGSTGHIESIIQLIAPRYDAERHGPATGINLLQAYLATRNPGAAQHVLDLLFALEKPELEERLWGFSNAIGEMLEAQRRGQLAHAGAPGDGGGSRSISLVSISKPIWAYGIEDLPGLLPAKNGSVRRVAFAQLASLGLPDFAERSAQPEDAHGRFCRGFPLWLAETLYFSPQYAPITAIGAQERLQYALFSAEWTNDNLRQLVETTSEPLDYVLTGAIQETSGDFSLVLRLWEVKKFRERKTFEAQWTPATADAELARLHEQLRAFFEWQPDPSGVSLPYTPPTSPTRWIDTLGASLSTFLADKGVIPREHLAAIPVNLADPHDGPAAALARLTLVDRAQRLGISAPSLDGMPEHALVTSAADLLRSQ